VKTEWTDENGQMRMGQNLSTALRRL